MVTESWVAWEPIPEVANRNWQIDLVHFEEASTEDSFRRRAGASAALAAYWEIPEPQVGAWRIDFHNVQAYRRRSWNHLRRIPVTTPDKKTERACWEVFPSKYVSECLPSDPRSPSYICESVMEDYTRTPYHHYVIMFGIHELLEIVAATWQSEPLPEVWAKPFGGPFPHW